MLRKLIAAACFAMLACAAVPSHAQPVKVVATCGTVTPAFATTLTSGLITMDVNGLLCTAASVSASITGFPTIQSTGTPISVTTSSVTGTLPTGAVVVASNVGATNGAYCKLGATATTSDQLIPPNSWFAFTVGANTQLSCITSSSTTTVNMVGGSGLPTGAGGGGSGGGGGTVVQGNAGSNAQAWWVRIGDATGGPAVVKAGNTFTASDVALGVAVTNTQTAVTPGDGITTTIYGTAPASPVIGAMLLWNGTTYDRWKSSGSTGIAAAGLFQGSTALSATNGTFFNQLQGNAVLSTTNPSFARPTDGTRAAIIDPCEANVQTFAPILMTTATTLRIIAPSASNKNYICSLFLKASAADNVALVEGTGGSCVTGIAGIIGGTTTANGFVFGTAGDGVLLQSGGKVAIAQTAGTNVDTCLITSTTGPLIGSIRYVQAP